jgi:hypothetical protein
MQSTLIHPIVPPTIHASSVDVAKSTGGIGNPTSTSQCPADGRPHDLLPPLMKDLRVPMITTDQA